MTFIKTAGSFFCTGLTAILIAGANGASAQAPGLQPHQAVYDLSLTEVRMPGASSAGAGSFVVRLQKRCEDWVLLTQLQIGMVLENGAPLDIQSISASEESMDGRQLVFESELRMNDRLFDSLAGTATLADDGTGTVNIEIPEESTVALPRGTQFPIGAFHSTMARVIAGDKVIEYTLFDGSSPTAIKGTDIVAGTPEPLDQPPSGDADLLAGQAHRIVSSYFDMTATDAEPMSSNTSDVLENGITTRILLDIGMAEAEGVLTSIAALPEPEC